MSLKVDFSPGESAILGLRVARCNCDFFDHDELYKEITENSYDVCRLKVPAEDEMASSRLNKMGLPFFFSGSIRRYKTKITEPPPGDYNFSALVFEMYDGTQDQLLKDMLIGTWGTYPIGYYRTPYLESIVTKEKEIDCVFQFYKKYNLNKNYPQNSILFIKHGDAYVGFFALNIVGNNLESHIGGILSPYRKSGYFLDKLRYIKQFCIEHKLEHFIFGARNENAEVQKIFQFVGFHARGSENVFHIPALLAFSQKEPVIEDFYFDKEDGKLWHQQLMLHAQRLAEDLLPDSKNFSFQMNQMGYLNTKQRNKIRLSLPVLNARELLIVMKGEANAPSAATGYFRAFK